MIDPRGMTLRDYADSVILTRSDAWTFSRLDDESKWQSWAVELLRARNSGVRLPPDPYQFDNWRDWAERAYTMLEHH